MSSILSNETDSLLQSFDIIRISPSPEDDERYRAAVTNNLIELSNSSSICVDAQTVNNIDNHAVISTHASISSCHTPSQQNSFSICSGTSNYSGPSSLVSTTSAESVVANNVQRNLHFSIGPTDKSTSMATSHDGQRTSLNSKSHINSLSDIGPGVIMGTTDVSNLGDFSYLNEPQSENAKVLELQARFIKSTEDILKQNNLKLRQQYAKLQKFQDEVQEAAEQSAKHIEERDREILKLKTTINELEIKLENFKSQNDWSQENFRVNLNFLETENFELKKNISEKLAIISNMSAEIKKIQDQNIYLSNNAKTSSMEKPAKPIGDVISLGEHKAKIKELERNNSALLAENFELRDMHTKYKNEIHAREVHLVEVQERGQGKIVEIARLNAELANEKQVTSQLREQVGVLEIHLAGCKMDFERERTERATLAGNREEFVTQLKMAQKRNQQLQDELKKHHLLARGKSSAVNNSRASPPRATPNRNNGDFTFVTNPSFICPICSRNFPNYVTLENHVQQCLE